VLSAGAEAMSALDPDAVAAMWEVGIEISRHQAKTISPFLRERVSYVITLCDRQIEPTCPIFPGAIWRLTWPIENPATARNRDEPRAMVRRARDEIRQRVSEFVQANS
jgi:arsenate reductase (thioredoxin)